MNHLIKTKKEFNNLKKQEVQDIFTKMNWTNRVFNMIRFIEILDIQQKTASDKVLKDKVFNIANNPKYYGYQGCLASMA